MTDDRPNERYFGVDRMSLDVLRREEYNEPDTRIEEGLAEKKNIVS